MSQTRNPVDQIPDPVPDPPHSSNASPNPNPSPKSEPQPAEVTQVTNPDVTSTTAAGTLKRRRDEGNNVKQKAGTLEELPASKRRVKATHDLIYRIVVPAWQIGKVIGRGGHRIQKIRDETKATIKIADAISRHEERVIIISSKFGDNVFSDAEIALHQIASLILTDDGTTEPVQIGAGHMPANAIRLLIAGSQAGGLIGVSGQNIENLRNSSGATITVLSPNQLPPYASAHESDRVAQISGDIPAVLRAVVEIGCQLRGNPPKQVISVNPAHNIGFHPNHPQPQHYVDPASSEYVTLDLMVPENLVGGLIGRFGANISRIRNESGANIKVHGGRGEQTQRQIHLSGNAQQVNLARQRVDEYMYAEMMRQGGGQLPQSAGVVQQVVTQPPMPEMPNPLYQGYGHHQHAHPHPHPHGLYANSSYEAGMMAPIPPPPPPTYHTYAPAAPEEQPHPPRYGYQSYPHYPAPPL